MHEIHVLFVDQAAGVLLEVFAVDDPAFTSFPLSFEVFGVVEDFDGDAEFFSSSLLTPNIRMARVTSCTNATPRPMAPSI